MQIRDLNRVCDGLRQQGVALHLISAETGGTTEVTNRLVERDTHPRYPVHSDPEHKLLLPLCGAEPGSAEAHSLFVKREINASKYGGTYLDYVLVQPALVVVDRTGAVQQTWSWRTKPLVSVELKEEMTPVQSFGGAVLVLPRPDASDIGPSINKGRQVRRQGGGMVGIMGAPCPIQHPSY